MSKSRLSRKRRKRARGRKEEALSPQLSKDAGLIPGHRSPPILSVLLPLLIVVAGVAAYANSFSGKLLFDDDKHILQNQRIHEVFPLSTTMEAHRPIADLSFAINYHFGLDKESNLPNPQGFHAVNLTIHLLAGLTLFGIVRRTLLRDEFRKSVAPAAPWLAMVVAVIWVVHPLQTQSVTYIVQRCESLMGLFYLLTLYCVVRGVDSPRSHFWYALAIAACALGMGSKPVMVTAPVVVLLYDLLLASKSPAKTFRRRWGLYLGLAASVLVLFACHAVQGIFRTTGKAATVGFSVRNITPLDYLVTQPGVIVYYLRLSFWPHPLCLDYNWPIVSTAWEFVRPATVIAVLLVGTIWGFLKRPWVGFVGAWFFIILAPTSSFIPIKDPLFEHRTYLPLAAVIVIVVVMGYSLLKYLAAALSWGRSTRRVAAVSVVAAIVALLTYGTILRNRDYHDVRGMWNDVIAKRPTNHRAFLGLGTEVFNDAKAMAQRGADADAKEAFIQAHRLFAESVRLEPDYPDGQYNLGNVLGELDRDEEAVQAFHRALKLSPLYAKAHYNLGNVLKKLNRMEEAAASFERAIRSDPKHISAHINLGNTLKVLGRVDQAIEWYGKALKLNPNHASAHYNLGDAYRRQGKMDQAAAEYQQALRFNPNHQAARRALERISP